MKWYGTCKVFSRMPGLYLSPQQILVYIPPILPVALGPRVFPIQLMTYGQSSFSFFSSPYLCGSQTSNVNQNHLGCLFKLSKGPSHRDILIYQIGEEVKNTHALIPHPWILIKCSLLWFAVKYFQKLPVSFYSEASLENHQAVMDGP